MTHLTTVTTSRTLDRMAGRLGGGSSPGIARIRYLAARRFAAWLAASGGVHARPDDALDDRRDEASERAAAEALRLDLGAI